MLQAGPQPEPTSMHPGNSFWLPSALHAGALRQCPGRFGCPPLCMQALSGSVPGCFRLPSAPQAGALRQRRG